jgi:hypothetical protein
MRAPWEILAEHRIPRAGNNAYLATCPQCSYTRRKKNDRCLSVLIDGRGVRAHCHHCDWKLAEFYDTPSAPDRAVASKPVIIKCSNVDDDQARIRRAREIWGQSVDPIGTLVERYLARRGLCLNGVAGRVVRFHKACPWKDDETDQLIHVPAMIAIMRDVRTNELRAIQVTALRPDGSKRGRKTRGVAAGACIKLSPDDNVEYGLTIGEGLETVLAGMKFGFQPAWACGGTSNLENFPILAGINALTILVDHDEAGLNAAEICRDRWIAAGREVHCIIPPRGGKDMNDLIKEVA